MRTAGNYTSFSPIDDRFDYCKKGVFFCKYNRELLYIALLCAGIALVAGLIFAVDTNNSSLAGIVFTYVKLGTLIFTPFFLIAGIRTIRSGTMYTFTATDEKMLIVCPHENFRADIFYSTIENVTYEEIMYFSKLRGFHVTVYCTHGMYRFEYLFAYKAHSTVKKPEYTPFRYLEERAGLIKQPEYFAGSRLDNPLWKG